jgi:hypothetical protein
VRGMMINSDIEKITKDDLQTLTDNGVIEHKTLEYKQILPGNSDKEKKEFLADVTSFANASGGDIIYGIVEDKKTGKPKSLDGLSIENPDQEILRLDGIIRNGVQPRLPSATFSKPIPIKEDKIALVIRVPKSWISPHRVILGGHDKFYSRSSNGKYPLDVGELRIAFNLSETITERIRNFKLDRISKILANETPVSIYQNAKIVLHLIPIMSFNPAITYDIGEIAAQSEKFKPIYCYGWNFRYNIDGLLSYSRGKEEKAHSYAQLFRNGIIEAVETLLLESHKDKLYIPSVAYEKELIKSLNDYINTLKHLSVEPPIFVFLSLLGVKNYIMAVDTWRHDIDEIHGIDRDILQLPEFIVENYETKAEYILKPSFDSIWNACGFKQSFNYNENGEWAPR